MQLLKRLFAQLPFNHKHSFSDLLLYGKFIDSGVVLQTDGSLLSSYYYNGIDFIGLSDKRLNKISNDINKAFLLFKENWMLHIDFFRLSTNVSIESSTNQQEMLYNLQNEQCDYYSQKDVFYKNHYVINITFKPNRDLLVVLNNEFEASILSTFKDHLHQLISLLPDELCLFPMNDQEMLSYISFCITGQYVLLNIPVNYGIYLKHFLAHKDLVLQPSSMVGEKHFAVLTLMGFPEFSNPRILSDVFNFEFEYRFNTRFIFLGKHDSKRMIDKVSNLWYQKRLNATDVVKLSLAIESNVKVSKYASSQYEEAQNAQHHNELGDIKFGFYTAVFVVFSDCELKLNNNIRLLRNKLLDVGFQSNVESYHLLDAYLGSLPGYAYANIRKWLISTQNLADLMPTNGYWGGVTCPSLDDFYAITNGSNIFHFSLQVNGLGHSILYGSDGIDYFVNYVCALQCARYNDKYHIFIYDDLNRSVNLCHNLNGNLVTIGDLDNSFQPLAYLDSDTGFLFAMNWLEELCKLYGLYDFSDAERIALNKALTLCKHAPKHQRTLTYLRYLVHDFDRKIATVLAIFSKSSVSINGELEPIFDGDKDFYIDKINVFQFNKSVLSSENFLILTLKYLFYIVERCIQDSHPILLIINQEFLKYDFLSISLANWLLKMSRCNVSVLFVIQDIYTVTCADTLLNQCITKIYSYDIYQEIDASLLSVNDELVGIINNLSKYEYLYSSSLGKRVFRLYVGELMARVLGE